MDKGFKYEKINNKKIFVQNVCRIKKTELFIKHTKINVLASNYPTKNLKTTAHVG